MKKSYSTQNFQKTFTPSEKGKSKRKSKGKSETKDYRETVVFLLVSDEEGAVSLPYQLWADPIKQFIKEKGSTWCPVFKIWKMPRVQFQYVKRDLPTILTAHYQYPPNFIKMVAQPLSENILISNHQYSRISYDIKNKKLYNVLYPFQRQTLQFCLSRYGRILIADQMGVGKSLQSLACSIMFPQCFPMLVICPSALKHVWKDQIKKWLKDFVSSSQVIVVKKGTLKEGELLGARIIIVSYEVSSKITPQLQNCAIVICDEAHYLKNPQTARCSQLIPFLQRRKRVILLTGTPALAKPKQLYNILQILRPDIFTSLDQFGERYCFKRRNPWSHKLQFDGAKNLAQLHYILKKTVMIRRLKQQVLPQLPTKQRQIILLDTQRSVVSEIKQLLQTKVSITNIRSSEKLLQMFYNSSQATEHNQIMRCYMLSGIAKLNSVKQYISQILENDVKIIVFAHHKIVMDQIESHLKSTKLLYIRLDGEVSPETRKKKVDLFQQDSSIKVALLSMTAMGTGFTLTAASTVIFVQLHWTPAVLIQAQDRSHRIGQNYSVNIHYLIGDQTLDPLMLRQLQKKVGTVSKVLDGQDENMKLQILEKGQMGNVSIPTQPQQNHYKLKKITDYFPQKILEHPKYDQKKIQEQNCRVFNQKMKDEKDEEKQKYQQIIEDMKKCENNEDSDESFIRQFIQSKRKTLKVQLLAKNDIKQ